MEWCVFHITPTALCILQQLMDAGGPASGPINDTCMQGIALSVLQQPHSSTPAPGMWGG